MDPAASLLVVKSFSYRGATQLWSNRYHLLEDAPSTDADWTLLMDAVVLLEKAVLPSSVTIVEAKGYTTDDAPADFTKTYSTAGTFSGFDAHGMPGDAAALVRYSTNVRSTKGHPIYCFNYYHGCQASGSNADNLNADYKTALETYASSWVTGISAGAAGTFHRATPHGQSTVARTVSPFVRHRDFPG